MSYYARDPGDDPEAPCYCGGQAPGPVLTTAEHCPACGDPNAPVAEPEDFAAEYRQSTTACCPRETIPDSCGCPDGCSCLCADCDCGTGCDCGDDGDDGDDYFDLKAENDLAADLGPEV